MLFSISGVLSQSSGYAWGVKVGPSLITQKWKSYNRALTTQYHADIFIDSYNEESANSLYGQLGYHIRGSSDRSAYHIINGQSFKTHVNKYLFENIVLELGFKKRNLWQDKITSILGFGIRGEYTIGTNLNEFEAINDQYTLPVYAIDAFVKPFNYGMSLLAGIEYPIADLYEIFATLSFAQDFSRQYYQPPVPGFFNDQYGNRRSIGDVTAYNTSIELSVGIRIYRIREY